MDEKIKEDELKKQQELDAATPLNKFVRFQTLDRQMLHGLLWSPSSPTKKVVLYVPGMGGGFSCPNDLNTMARCFNEAGLSFMAMNTRTVCPTGILMLKFEDCLPDIEAAIEYVKSCGYDEIVLVGDSLGAVRIAYYLYRRKDTHVTAVVLLGAIVSPYSEAQMRWSQTEKEEFDDFLEAARMAIERGNGNQIMFFPNWAPGRPLMVSANTVINVFGRHEETAAGILKYVKAFNVPTLVLHGKNDQISLPENGETIYKHLPTGITREIVFVEADHFFPDPLHSKMYADAMIYWISGLNG